MADKRHSEEFFGESRDLWWNKDFLALMVQRWQVSEIRDVLDAGCGIGHWGFALEPHLPRGCRVIGIDREKDWVAAATERARQKTLDQRFSYQQGTVEALPFADNSFDMVTCQTVLIHVPDPRAVLREFMRVLKPGGLLAVVEPNNLGGSLILSSLDGDVEELFKGVRFQVFCDRGKEALGEGNSSLGDLVPGFVQEVGYQDIQVYLSDKATPLYAPYEGDQQVMVAQMREWLSEEFLAQRRVESQRYFLAGGGSQTEFDQLWTWMSSSKTFEEGIAAGTFHCGGGAVQYLVSGRKGEAASVAREPRHAIASRGDDAPPPTSPR